MKERIVDNIYPQIHNLIIMKNKPKNMTGYLTYNFKIKNMQMILSCDPDDSLITSCLIDGVSIKKCCS